MVIEVVCICVCVGGGVTLYLIWLNNNFGLYTDKINQTAVISDCVTTETFKMGLIQL